MSEDASPTNNITEIERLLKVMATLRDPDHGCEWDLAQDFMSIAPYTIEEAYEVADAIERSDMIDLQEELGDLLLQVVFHAQMANEQGIFAFADVAKSISDKMEDRHPHIFGSETGTMGEARWEAMKEQERARKGETSAMDGVALALPALMRAQKLQKRAARTGFDWPDPSGSEAKIYEEIEELKSATCQSEQIEEAGDLLFAVVNYIRANGVNAEEALRAANSKFEDRFKRMENLAGAAFVDLTLDEKEELWQEVKKNENQRAKLSY
ncbi:nucleoside triphosphate pyrophosphohydrolase [Erythrobacter crassostreae]|uniref:Nucleoside triphosphate pyrophosphohydrolase n=1 Tax=Erythrobacter crassostreae TaxID=2828328 RepID=A0A9X1F4C1_9SPHN|nr:nucleoside triphosphate pyrophosphohydrolase [Erythrobacter crassostrea]MBV7260026.1 nucleoside triphosphate pyrophosphohydrolase [Erythrobacter crassostrea]